MKYICTIVCSYLIGGIPFAYILVKLKTGKDIRTIGSGNVGGTNAARAAGLGIGLLVGLLDALKGALPTYIALKYGGINLGVIAGISAVVGHSFTPFLSFRGGKGVATSLGSFLVLLPSSIGIAFLVWVVVFALTRLVSLGSILAALAFAVHGGLTAPTPILKIGAVLAGILVVVRHRSNIRRLLRGEEPKFKVKYEEDEQDMRSGGR